MSAPTLVLPDGVARGEWLTRRRKGIGGSDAAAILGLDPYRSAFEVYLDKIGDAPERQATDAMDWGNRLEPVIADWFSETTGLPTSRAGLMAHPEHEWMLATVDRLIGDDALLEIKNTSVYRAKDWADGQVPDAAELQTQHYLGVTGRRMAYVAVLIGGNRPEIREVQRDDALIGHLIRMESEFWARVQSRTPPPVDGSEACADLLGRLWTPDPESVRVLSLEAVEALRALPAAKAAAKAATEAATELENRVKHELADKEFGVIPGPDGNRTAVTWKTATTNRVNTAALKKAHPDIAAEFTSTTTSRRFVLKEF